MKHVSERWLHKLHLFFTIFAALSIGAYLCCTYIPSLHRYTNRVGDSPLIFIAPVLLIIYNFSYYKVVRRRNKWIATMASYLLLTLFFIFALQPTGGFSSFWIYLWGICGFLGGMLGIYAAALPAFLIFIGTVRIYTSNYPVHSSTLAAVTAITVDIALFVLGGLIWSRYYISQDNPISGHFLQEDLLKSDFILNAMTDGVILIDSKETIMTFNKAATGITGWPASEAVGLDYHSVVQLIDDKGKSYDSSQDLPSQSLKDGKPRSDNNAYLLTKSKKKISINISVSPLLDDKNLVTGAVVVFRDVGKERQTQQRTADFISTASHEMRTPVAAIEGYLALALNDKVSTIDSRARSFLEKAHISTLGLGKLFQDLLTSAKADDGRLSNHPSVIEMSKFLEDLTNDLRFTAQKKGLTTDFALGSNKVIDATSSQNRAVITPLYYIYADPDRLREVMTNLFDNAVKYTDQGKISIGLTADKNNVQFFVQDSGAGIPAEDIPHLFQKFYRVDNSATRSIGGTGLGLFISSKIIELYQGQMWVESELGKGSTFFVNIPRLSAENAQQLTASASASSSPLSSN